jgi:flagellar protein FlbD
MIRLTKINHVDVVINSDLIEHIETTPDTVLTLTSGQKIMVLESPDEIVDRVVAFRKRIGKHMTEAVEARAGGGEQGSTEGIREGGN